MTVVADASGLPDGFAPSAVVFAVKPQNAAETLPQYQRFAGQSVFLSIMAGRTIGGMRSLLGDGAAIVRAMPNTPAAVRQGVTVACPGEGVSTPQRVLCERLLEAIGVVAWVDDEALLDPVTAVSGSGPAYVFLLAELMEEAAREQGIPPNLRACWHGRLLRAPVRCWPRARRMPRRCASRSPALGARRNARSRC